MFLTTPASIKQEIIAIYAQNAFMHLVGIQIEKLACGQVELGLDVVAGKHTNLNDSIHGGVLATMADNALGIVCATVGKRVVTVSMQLAFIKGIKPGEHATAKGTIISNDGKTMVVQVGIYHGEQLLLDSMSTMMVINDFSAIPPQW
ncbi:MAG: PaaI family thioesterase [Acidaminococcaceae bacterium]